MRTLLVAAVFTCLGVVLAGAWRDTHPPPPPPSRAAIHQQLKDCRDLCEQTVIVENLPEERLRACRANCEARHPAPPKEPIRRITVAPADHSRTIRDEK